MKNVNVLFSLKNYFDKFILFFISQQFNGMQAEGT